MLVTRGLGGRNLVTFGLGFEGQGQTTPDPYYQPFGGPKSEYFDWTPHRKKQKRAEQLRRYKELSLFLLLME
jgi:hypothetical protein